MSGKGKKAATAAPQATPPAELSALRGFLDEKKDSKIDPTTQEKLAQIHQDISEQAWKIIHEDMPQKVVELEEFIKTTTLLDMANMPKSVEKFEDMGYPVIPDKAERTAGNSPEAADSSGQKKRKIGEHEGESAPFNAMTTPIPCNKSVLSLVYVMKPNVFELVEMIDTVRMWIQLNIPKIEDGNNFGVSIQEEILAELSKAEESSLGMLETVSRYHMARAKLVSKVMKYPYLEDYRRCVYELDEKSWFDFRISIIDLKNNYAILLDLILKNIERLRNPRSSHHRDMF